MRRTENLRRRRATRTPKQRFLIICEGRVTEPRYFNQIRHLMRSPIDLEVLPGGDPKLLVELAVQRKRESDLNASRNNDSYLAYDQIWCVCDVDQHERLRDALQQAKANLIQVALSNPCFELWALLHFQDQTAHIERAQARHLCKKYMPGYDKELPCSTLMQFLPDAVKRATELAAMHQRQNTHRANPSTEVYLLIAEIESQRQS